ncbi:helix-turn-helix domain-containing protein [Streptomyces niger]|uniref:helix-turn-helix domain-containing protein n=1 Tax=Streptomyces niger TaxID=66373 RepID=UPI000699B2BE|nr:XRE family transcriptional regulator [Streptomyces niger]
MSNMIDPLVGRIGARVRVERERRRWTLAQLAEASGVSRAMIHRIERGESSPTAVVLGKLSGAFRISVSALMALAEGAADQPADGPDGGTEEGTGDIAEWRDPATGYSRRQISGPRFPADIAEVRLPAGARIPYPAETFAFVRQMVWVLDGRLTFHEGDAVHELAAGHRLELGAPAPCTFVNDGAEECRYAVVRVRSEAP